MITFYLYAIMPLRASDPLGSASDQRFPTIVLCRPASRTAYGLSDLDITSLTPATRCRRALTILFPTSHHHTPLQSELIFTRTPSTSPCPLFFLITGLDPPFRLLPFRVCQMKAAG